MCQTHKSTQTTRVCTHTHIYVQRERVTATATKSTSFNKNGVIRTLIRTRIPQNVKIEQTKKPQFHRNY